MSQSAFITGFPQNTLLVGTGDHTNGLVLSVAQAHASGQPTLQGKFKIIANHDIAHNLLAQHLPSHELESSENTFEAVRASILAEVGVQDNADIVNKNLFHPDQWSAHFQPSEPLMDLVSGAWATAVGGIGAAALGMATYTTAVYISKLYGLRPSPNEPPEVTAKKLAEKRERRRKELVAWLSNLSTLLRTESDADLIENSIFELCEGDFQKEFRVQSNRKLVREFITSEQRELEARAPSATVSDSLSKLAQCLDPLTIDDTYDAMIWMEVGFIDTSDELKRMEASGSPRSLDAVLDSYMNSNIKHILWFMEKDSTYENKDKSQIWNSRNGSQLRIVAEYLTLTWANLTHYHLTPSYFQANPKPKFSFKQHTIAGDPRDPLGEGFVNKINELLISQAQMSRLQAVHKRFAEVYDIVKAHGYEWKPDQYDRDPRKM